MLDVRVGIWADAHPELADNPGVEALGLSVPALHCQITGHLKRRGFALAAACAGGRRRTVLDRQPAWQPLQGRGSVAGG